MLVVFCPVDAKDVGMEVDTNPIILELGWFYEL